MLSQKSQMHASEILAYLQLNTRLYRKSLARQPTQTLPPQQIMSCSYTEQYFKTQISEYYSLPARNDVTLAVVCFFGWGWWRGVFVSTLTDTNVRPHYSAIAS